MRIVSYEAIGINARGQKSQIRDQWICLTSDFGPLSSLFSVLCHARLLVVEMQGRIRINRINAVTLGEVLRRWAGPYQAMWADSLLNIRDQAEGFNSHGKGAES